MSLTPAYITLLSTQVAPVRETAERLSDMRDKNITHMVEEETLLLWITGIVIGLFAMALLFFLATLVSRKIKNIKMARVEVLDQKYLQFLSELISGEAANPMHGLLGLQSETTLSLDKDDIAKALPREVLKTNLLELHRHLAGEEKGKLREVYLMWGYAKEALKDLNAKQYERRVAAIGELAQMDIRDAYQDIFELINDKTEVVRDKAIKARAQLDVAPLSMLSELEHSLSPWQQTFIYNALVHFHSENLPSLQKYLDAEREDIVLFSMTLAGKFYQTDCVDILLAKLEEESRDIRYRAIEVLGQFPSPVVKEKLQLHFDGATEAGEQHQVLKALESMLNTEDTDWLFALLSADDRDLVITAARFLQTINENADLALAISPEKEEWLQHALDASIHQL